MAFLHCHNCGWSQDDYWDERYNPITFLERAYKKQLLNDPLDKVVEMDGDVLDENGENHHFIRKVKNRDIIAKQLRKAASIVEKMKFKTHKEFMASDRKCPRCGSDDMDVD